MMRDMRPGSRLSNGLARPVVRCPIQSDCLRLGSFRFRFM